MVGDRPPKGLNYTEKRNRRIAEFTRMKLISIAITIREKTSFNGTPMPTGCL